MPFGNLTSQFFSNIYLNELDQFVKRNLQVKHYLRYVDDFVILHKSVEKLTKWKEEINEFLQRNLKIKLHPQKSKIISIKQGVDFVGFRIFRCHRLLRKRKKRKVFSRIKNYERNKVSFSQLHDSYNGWKGHAQCANTYKLRKKIKSEIITALWNKL